MKREIEAVLPQEYIGSAPFDMGVYFVSSREIFRYAYVAEREERFPIGEIVRELGDVCKAVTDESGEYLFLVFRRKHVLYGRRERRTYEIEAEMPISSYIDKGKIVNLYKNTINVYAISDIISKKTNPKQFTIRKDRRIDVIDKLVCHKGRVILSGGRMIELSYADILSDPVELRKLTIFAIEEELKKVTISMRVKKPVLMKPEPITFMGEDIQKEYFTEWGLVVVYATGVEVYRTEGENYRLEYVYTCAPEIVRARESLEISQRVFLKNGREVVEIKKTGPFKIAEVEEQARVFSGTSWILVLSSENYVVGAFGTRKSVRIKEKAEITEKHRELQQSLVMSAEECKIALDKYAKIDYKIIEGRTEVEQKIIVEKILNSFKAQVSNRFLVISLLLQEKLRWTKSAAEEMESCRKEIFHRAEKLADKNKCTIERASKIVEMLNRAQREVSKKGKETKEETEIRKRIGRIQENIRRNKEHREETSKMKGPLCLLRQQKELLLKKIESLQRLR